MTDTVLCDKCYRAMHGYEARFYKDDTAVILTTCSNCGESCSPGERVWRPSAVPKWEEP